MPKISATRNDLSKSDFVVFKNLNDIPLGMTAHILYEDLDNKLPATQSKKIIEIVRTELKFNGLLMTDDLSMKALTGTFEDKVKKALKAGCDLILHSNGNMAEMDEISQFCGSLSPERNKFSDMVLRKRKTSSSIDIQKLINEYDVIIDNISLM